MRVRSKGRTNLGLYEITTGSVSLFPACYLQGTPQLQRVEPSARGPPTFRLLRVALYSPCYLQERTSGSGGRTRFERARRRDSMCAEPKPRTAMTTETIIVERRGRVGIVRLNRPQALNALNATLRNELLGAVEAFDADAEVGCILITGSDKAFAAGADIKEMADKSYIDIFRADYAADYERLTRVRKPVIAAVAGFALGGGCELAMMCDFIIAADNAKFGQPEIKLGIIPGIGGTQRLARAVGKAKAMDLILTGRMMDAAEAERSGLVARVVPAARLMEEALKVAETIAAMSQPSLLAAKEAVNRSFETSLAEGVRFERRVFHALFATKDRKEGMAAFIEKRPPRFTNE
jgi:enoyl-CoA hydratase